MQSGICAGYPAMVSRQSVPSRYRGRVHADGYLNRVSVKGIAPRYPWGHRERKVMAQLWMVGRV